MQQKTLNVDGAPEKLDFMEHNLLNTSITNEL